MMKHLHLTDCYNSKFTGFQAVLFLIFGLYISLTIYNFFCDTIVS